MGRPLDVWEVLEEYTFMNTFSPHFLSHLTTNFCEAKFLEVLKTAAANSMIIKRWSALKLYEMMAIPTVNQMSCCSYLPDKAENISWRRLGRYFYMLHHGICKIQEVLLMVDSILWPTWIEVVEKAIHKSGGANDCRGFLRVGTQHSKHICKWKCRWAYCYDISSVGH